MARKREKSQHGQQRPSTHAGRLQGQEVIGAVEEALEKSKAEFDSLVDTERTADAINDLFIKTVTSAVQP